jgi:hypothetical protein
MEQLIGWLGLILTLATLPLAIITYISPKHRLNRYLNHPSKWKEIDLDLLGFKSIWQFTPHPEFTIKQLDDTEEWAYDAVEPWMTYHFPDSSKRTYRLHVRANDVVVYSELFISLDGGRYFVPLPRVAYAKDKSGNNYYYEPIQIKISRIVGSYYRMSSIDEFINSNNLKVTNSEISKRKIIRKIWELLVG